MTLNKAISRRGEWVNPSVSVSGVHVWRDHVYTQDVAWDVIIFISFRGHSVLCYIPKHLTDLMKFQ